MFASDDSQSQAVSSKKSSEVLRCERKCMHYGDRICYNDVADKEILQKIPENALQTDSNESVDSLHSGESLFKTFSFDGDDNDQDMEKCMEFWRKVMETNVKPIKCTLVKPKKIIKQIAREAPEKVDPCDNEKTKKMWLDVYKDLQRRQLDKIKLGKKAVCDPCGEYIDEEELKKQDKEDIKNLNEWAAHSKPTRMASNDVKMQLQRTLNVLQKNRASKHLLETSTKDERTVKAASKKNPSVTDATKSSTQTLQPKLSLLQANKSQTRTPQFKQSKLSLLEAKESLTQISQPKQSKLSLLEANKSQTRTPQFKQSKLGLLEAKKSSSQTKQPKPQSKDSICCNCGCWIKDCICEVLEELEEAATSTSCKPCSCGDDCVCEELAPDSNPSCTCGCKVDECICQNVNTKKCTCKCGVDACICQDGCCCGCGVDDCICGQLFTKLCKCGRKECDCDMVGVLSAYLDSLKTSSANLDQVVEVISTQTQTACASGLEKGRYCVICGNFNCYCKDMAPDF